MITSHVLDTTLGRPAAGVNVTLAVRESDGSFRTVGRGATGAGGRVDDLLGGAPLEFTAYRLRFHTADYFRLSGRAPFFAEIDVCFFAEAGESHYHVPLLLSAYGYTVYRGS